MQTMQPIVIRGCSAWDQERLPVDEFGERLRSVQNLMKQNGMGGLIIYGNCRHYSNVCYLSNYIPMLGWALLLVPVSGNPTLFVTVPGTRDLPFFRSLTWVEDVRPSKNVADEVAQFIEQIRQSQNDKTVLPTVGICGGEEMRHSFYYAITTGTEQCVLKSMDTELFHLMHRKRPREIAAVREAIHILQSSVEALKEVHRRGGSDETAIIEADRAARNLGAQDIRVMYGLESGLSLQPLGTLSDIRNDPMIAYVAVEYLGYWAEATVTLTHQQSPIYQKAEEVLNFFIASLKSGVKIDELVLEAAEIIKPYHLHPVVQGGFGHSIGLSLEEKPLLDLTYGESTIESGSLFSVYAGLTDHVHDNVLLSAIILVNEGGSEILWSSI